LLETEEKYFRDIRTIHWEFNLGSGEVLSQQEQNILFINIGKLVVLHTELAKELHEAVRKKWSYHQTVADIIEKYVSKFSIYEKYIINYREATDFLQKARQSTKIDKYFQSRESKPYCHGLNFESFLVMPVQRLPRYILLLKELRKYTDIDHPDYVHINSAMAQLDELAKRVNEAQRGKETHLKISQILSTVHGADEVTLGSPFIYEGPVSIKKISLIKQGLVRSLSFSNKSFTKTVWKEIYVFLFNDTMLCAKKISSSPTQMINLALHGQMSYKFSATKAYPIDTTTRLEINASNPCKFKLVNEDEATEFLSASPQARELWVHALAKTKVTQANTTTTKEQV